MSNVANYQRTSKDYNALKIPWRSLMTCNSNFYWNTFRIQQIEILVIYINVRVWKGVWFIIKRCLQIIEMLVAAAVRSRSEVWAFKHRKYTRGDISMQTNAYKRSSTGKSKYNAINTRIQLKMPQNITKNNIVIAVLIEMYITCGKF